MRRTRLVWFALGLALGVALPFVADLLLPKQKDLALVLTISEPVAVDEASVVSANREQVALNEYRGAAMAKACGVSEFRVTLPTHGGAQTDVVLADANEHALDCLVQNAAVQSMALQFKRMSAP